MNLLPSGDGLGGFCGWLWQTSLEASVLIALVWALQSVLGKWLRPASRYALSLLVLFRLLLPVAPASPFSIFNLMARFPTAPPQSRSENSALGSTGYQPVPSGNLPDGTGVTPINNPGDGLELTSTAVPVGRLPTGAGKLPAPPILQLGSQTVSTVAPDARLISVAQFIWALGFVWMLVGVFVRHRKFSRWVRGQPVVTGDSALALLAECRSILNVRRPVALIQAAGLSTPALFGFWRPRLLLPPNVLNAFDPAEQRMVFLHELAHIKRGDILLNWLMIGVRALHWFNPLVWLALRRLRSDRELVCDEIVLARLDAAERTQYGHTLIKLMNDFSQAGFCPSLVPAINRKQEIKRRIVMIAQFKPGSRLAAVFSLPLVLIVGAFTFTRAADQSANQPNANLPSNRAEQDRRRIAEKGIAVLQKQAAEQEQRLKEAQKEMDRLRMELKISDVESGNGIVGMEPETVRSIERDRFSAEGMRAYYSSLVETLRNKSKAQLRDVLPTANPDVQLTELLSKLSQAQTELKALESKYKPQHPAMQAAEASIKELNSQVDARVEGILQGLETLATAYKSRASELEKYLVPAKEKDAQLKEEFRPYFAAKRNVENQQRIYETIKLRLLQETVDAALRPQIPFKAGGAQTLTPPSRDVGNESPNAAPNANASRPTQVPQGQPTSSGRNSNENFNQSRPSDAKDQKDARTPTNVDRSTEPRTGTNQWDEVARLLRETLTADGSQRIKRNVQQLALLELAGVSEKRGQVASAQQFLSEYVERYPADPILSEVLLRQGLLHRKAGEFAAAMSKFYLVLSSAVRFQGTNSGANLAYYQRISLTARSEIAETEFMAGQYKEAASHFEALLRDPSNELDRSVVTAKLIRSLAKAGDHAGVVQYAENYLKENPASEPAGEVRGLLAAAYENLGRKEDALRLLADPSPDKQPAKPGKGEPPQGRLKTEFLIPLRRQSIQPPTANNDRGDVAQPDRIVVNLANAGVRTYAMAQIALKGAGDDLIEQINKNRERLLDLAAGTIASKTLEEIEKPGFRNVLRSELLALFNQVLGGSAVTDVILVEFVLQRGDEIASGKPDRPNELKADQNTGNNSKNLNEGLIKTFLQNPEYREHRSLEIEVIPNGLVINLLDRPNQPVFQTGVGEFTAYGTWVVNTVAWEIARYPNSVLEVGGHTEMDFRSQREGYGSQEMSADIAAATRRRLLENGVKAAQILKTSGHADTKPLKGRTPEDRTNRRATLLIRDKDGKD